jgi:hypothetical protein
MTNSVHLGQVTDGTAGHRTHRYAPPQGPASFQQVLLRAFQGKIATSRYQGSVHRAVMRIPATAPAKPTAPPSGAAINALDQAMTLEGVPASWRPGLTFIMAQESGGRVDAKSPVHSARGLFQLTAANYHYNPNGAASFGNAVEEARGGIRYIRARYGNADNAMAFWRQHRWY